MESCANKTQGLDLVQMREFRWQIEEFNAEYARVLDCGDFYDWPRLFCPEPFYRVVDRYNYDSGLQYGLIYCDGLGMLEDRVQAVKSAMMYEPRTITHLITNVRVLGFAAVAGIVSAEANFLLIENLVDRDPRILMVGRYIDAFVPTKEGLLIKKRECVSTRSRCKRR